MRAKLMQTGIVLLAIFLPFSAPVFAAPQCSSLSASLTQLQAEYEEAVTWSGTSLEGSGLMIVANPDGTTWSALLLVPGNNACILAFGDAWEKRPMPHPPSRGAKP